MRVWAAVVGTLAAVFAGAIVPAGAQTPVKTVSLGKAWFGRMVVDDAHGHVLISETNPGVVLVFDEAGHHVGTIRGEPGAAGMAVVGDVLYVVQSTTGAIDRLDATTFARIGSIASGLRKPYDLAYAGGRLWVAVGGSPRRKLEAVDPETGATRLFKSPIIYEPLFGTSPAAPTALFVAVGDSSGAITRYDLSGGAPVAVATTAFGTGSTDFTVSGDGTRVVDEHTPHQYSEFGASDLQVDGTAYPGLAPPEALASTTGTVQRLATGEDFESVDQPTVQVFQYGRPTVVFSARPLHEVVPHGLAMTPEGDRLFVVTSTLGPSRIEDLWLNTYAVP
jgi:hypothetical protein